MKKLKHDLYFTNAEVGLYKKCVWSEKRSVFWIILDSENESAQYVLTYDIKEDKIAIEECMTYTQEGKYREYGRKYKVTWSDDDIDYIRTVFKRDKVYEACEKAFVTYLLKTVEHMESYADELIDREPFKILKSHGCLISDATKEQYIARVKDVKKEIANIKKEVKRLVKSHPYIVKLKESK